MPPKKIQRLIISRAAFQSFLKMPLYNAQQIPSPVKMKAKYTLKKIPIVIFFRDVKIGKTREETMKALRQVQSDIRLENLLNYDLRS